MWNLKYPKQEKILLAHHPTLTCKISPALVLHYTFFIFFPSVERTEEWRKAVPSYTQSSGGGSGTLELRTWSSLPRDDSLEPLPYNWEMAYTETGMVYFIEWVCGHKRRDLAFMTLLTAWGLLLSPSGLLRS